MSAVQMQAVGKAFGKVEVIKAVDLAINAGEFSVFVGPSGSGKSTLLRMISGLETTSSGQIFIGERDVTQLDPAQRGVAMVFQTYALYPHMTVRENMGFGLRMNGHPKAEIAQKVAEASRILKLDPYLDRKPSALSGGQRQRVSIGRAIVRGPEVFLFDEPLSNLDAELRVEMRVEIARLHREIGATMVYVTHDQVEAMTLADRIVVLRDGRIEQVDTPMALYHNPDNRFVAGFIGSPAMNFLRATVEDGGIHLPALGATLPRQGLDLPPGQQVEVGLRPEHMQLSSERAAPLQVELIETLGGLSLLHLRAKTGEMLVVEQRGRERAREGDILGVQLNPADALLFDAESGARLRRPSD